MAEEAGSPMLNLDDDELESVSWDARVARAASKLGGIRPPPKPGCTMRRQQRDALRMLVQHAGDSSVPLRTLHAIVRRCVEEPEEVRWRRLRLANPRMEREIVAHAGGVDFLLAAGFAPAEFGTTLVLPSLFGRFKAVRQLHSAVASLQAAAAAMPGGGLQLPAVDLGPSTRAAVGLMTVLTSDGLRQAVLGHLSGVELWSLRLVATNFPAWVDMELAGIQSLSVGEMLAQTLVPRRELAVLTTRCTNVKSVVWGVGGGRATPSHADAFASTLASGLRRAHAPLQSLHISSSAALSWDGLAAMLSETGQAVASGLHRLEFVAGEAASELSELADNGNPLADPQTGALVGHSSGVTLANALHNCIQLHTIALAGGGGDTGPNRTTLAAMGAWCPSLQSLSLDGCISIDGAAITALVDGETARAVLATPYTAGASVVVHGLGRTLSQSQCPNGPTRLCSTLTDLDISGCVAMSDMGLQALQRAGVRLRALHANDCRSLSDVGACCVVTRSLTTLELASRRQIGDQTLCCLAAGSALTALDISSGHGDAMPLSSDALLQLVSGCSRMSDFRAAYARLSVKFIAALGDTWGNRARADTDDLPQGLTHLDLSYCRTAATDDPVAVCDTLALALAKCVHMRTLALAGFAAMRPNALAAEDTAPVVHPADIVIEAVLAACPCLMDFNCSETDIGAGAVMSTLLQRLGSGNIRIGTEQTVPVVLTRVNFSGCRRLGGETFVALLRACPDLTDLNLSYCCNEEHAQVAIAEARGHVRAHVLRAHDHTDAAQLELTSVDARVITDNDLGQLRMARCAHKLQGLRLGGMGCKNDVPWPTVGGTKAFGDKGVSAALTEQGQGKQLSCLQTIDLSHSAVTNSTIVKLAMSSTELSRLNVVGSKCTRELHRMLREAGCIARVFGV